MKTHKIIKWILLLVLPAVLAGCSAEEEKPAAQEETAPAQKEELKEEMKMKMFINDLEVKVDWEENESVEALKQLLPLKIMMSMYGGFEQVGPIGQPLPRNDVQTQTAAGDLVLYAGDQLVVFYGSNSWAYTRLGHIADRSAEELSDLLGNGDVTITITAE